MARRSKKKKPDADYGFYLDGSQVNDVRGVKVRAFTVGVQKWIDTGREVGVRSSWVSKIRYLKDERELVVTFRDGFVAYYHNTSPEDAAGLFLASSMGKFVRAQLKGRSYN